MKLVKRIGKAFDRMIDSNPFITIGGFIITGGLAAVFIGFVTMKAPLLMLTMVGVGVMWVLVLFINKLVEEVKR